MSERGDRRTPDWQRYERLVARMVADQLTTDLCVTPNAWIRGRISKIKRQIDVLIEARHDTDNSRRVIVDAKRRRRKIDVTDVEAFRSLMEDVSASHGYLVCPAGYTKAAERRAQRRVSIRLVPLDQLEDFDPATWPQCLADTCASGRVFWDGYPGMVLRLRPVSAEAPPGDRFVQFVHYVGKCDRCGQFHVKCTNCGRILLIPENDDEDCGQQCNCCPPWFWLASVEQDARKRKSAELHVVFLSGAIRTVDRRSL